MRVRMWSALLLGGLCGLARAGARGSRLLLRIFAHHWNQLLRPSLPSPASQRARTTTTTTTAAAAAATILHPQPKPIYPYQHHRYIPPPLLSRRLPPTNHNFSKCSQVVPWMLCLGPLDCMR